MLYSPGATPVKRDPGTRRDGAMASREAKAFQRAITARLGGASTAIGIQDDADVEALVRQLATLTTGLTVGEALGEALAVGYAAGHDAGAGEALSVGFAAGQEVGLAVRDTSARRP